MRWRLVGTATWTPCAGMGAPHDDGTGGSKRWTLGGGHMARNHSACGGGRSCHWWTGAPSEMADTNCKARPHKNSDPGSRDRVLSSRWRISGSIAWNIPPVSLYVGTAGTCHYGGRSLVRL